LIIVSACLANIKTRYDGTSQPNEDVQRLVLAGEAIPVCPELLGGLPIPREATKIDSGGGWRILDKESRVLTESGADVTSEFILGAERVLKLAIAVGASRAILKSNSPSCGSGSREDDGVTTALLKKNGIEVLSEKQCQNPEGVCRE
jgi:uncharacterized protein YbbK (DUF523 family)